MDAIIKCLSKFEEYDYKNLSEEWNTMDYNYNNIKKILVNDKEISAKLMGINESGQLNCFHGEKIHAYNINEVQIIKDELFYAIDFGHTNYKIAFFKNGNLSSTCIYSYSKKSITDNLYNEIKKEKIRKNFML